MTKERLDILVQRQLNISRSKAQGLILTGNVYSAEDERLDKPGQRFPDDARFEIRQEPRFVSRGGDKLEAAFQAFELDIEGATALDAGASTGGFTDCMLQHGAARVYAVDVGYGQLAWKLRQDDRVVVMERTNIRHIEPVQIPDKIDFFSADCSFISLRLILPALRPLLNEKAQAVVLIKPQFEAGKQQVGRGGVVRDPQVREQAVEDVLACAGKLGFQAIQTILSPLKGPAGNREFLAHLKLG